MNFSPVYCDLHIHTYPDADNREGFCYDYKTLIDNMHIKAGEAEILLSLTDHNTLNCNAYSGVCGLLDESVHVIPGVEVHVRSNGERPYHAHLYFDMDPTDSKKLENLNVILDGLYPKKLPSLTDSIPTLYDILNAFRCYDFLFLPHGGQSHSTFDEAVAEGELCDDLMMRSAYYNAFDGFTARSASNVEKTERYFNKIGIGAFTNLLTGSDNYSPADYPMPKAPDAESFVPTWIFAAPTFEGLRLALSEETRLAYSQDIPESFVDIPASITRVVLNSDLADIDVELSPGLNVVIGGSSSGKTMLVEAIARATGAIGDGEKSGCYDKFGIDDVKLGRNDQTVPYYINQSYISKVVDKSVDHETIESIQILQDVFPEDSAAYEELNSSFSAVEQLVEDMFSSAKDAQQAISSLKRFRSLPDLLLRGNAGSNPFSMMKPSVQDKKRMEWRPSNVDKLRAILEAVADDFDSNPLLESIRSQASALMDVIEKGRLACEKNEAVQEIIAGHEQSYTDTLDNLKSIDEKNESDFEEIVSRCFALASALRKFERSKAALLSQRFGTRPKDVTLAGHKLSVTYSFEISPELLLEKINEFIPNDKRFASFNDITAESLRLEIVDGRKRIASLDAWGTKVASELKSSRTREYGIVTSQGKEWGSLSEGRKTAILLDLILGYRGNTAPLVIDQPEDNLASDYINGGLAKAILGSKGSRQTIIVTHNATIPILADAQTVVLCKQDDGGKVIIRSAPLEGELYGERMLDWIAEITDGGKPSVQKRFRKYNFRHFEGE